MQSPGDKAAQTNDMHCIIKQEDILTIYVA